ncbi:MAG: SGNH/GDSL hydrolase family protein, partial [Planctomycetota bacterium]
MVRTRRFPFTATYVLAFILALFAAPASADDNDVELGPPDVITALTPEEAQRIDQQRPEYVQPSPVEGHQPTALPLSPREGESLVFVGNALAARMEHFNHFETALHTQFSKQRLTFRNMGYPGHTPGYRPEAGNDDPWAFPGAKSFRPDIKGHLGIGHYPKPDEWLTIVKAGTIVAFFGFNESYDGLDGVDNFKNELAAFVDHTLSRSYERTQTAPRLVLATPIAMEQHGGFLLPDAAKRNAILKAYADAVGAVAAEKQVGCVNLFKPSLRWYEDATTPLTINGVHLSREGYAKLATE